MKFINFPLILSFFLLFAIINISMVNAETNKIHRITQLVPIMNQLLKIKEENLTEIEKKVINDVVEYNTILLKVYSDEVLYTKKVEKKLKKKLNSIFSICEKNPKMSSQVLSVGTLCIASGTSVVCERPEDEEIYGQRMWNIVENHIIKTSEIPIGELMDIYYQTDDSVFFPYLWEVKLRLEQRIKYPEAYLDLVNGITLYYESKKNRTKVIHFALMGDIVVLTLYTGDENRLQAQDLLKLRVLSAAEKWN